MPAPGLARLCRLQKSSSAATIASGRRADGRQDERRDQPLSRRSTRAGSATRPDSGARRRDAIDWIEKPKTVFDPNAGVYGRWFPDGVCNTCYNAVDRHVERRPRRRRPRSSTTRRSPAPKQTITYAALLTKTETLAGILEQDFGVEKGDRVILYMPMVPEALIAHARLRAASARCIRWCSAASRRRSSPPASTTPSRRSSSRRPAASRPARVIAYKPLLDAAIELAKHKPRRLPDPAAPAAHAAS